MENKDKEAFYSGELNEKRIAAYLKLAETYNITESSVRDIFCRGIDFAMESYHASQNEELRKENEGLNRVISKLFADKVEETRQLQSTIDELELKIHAKKHTITHHEQSDGEWRKIVDEKNKEIERLKVLIEQQEEKENNPYWYWGQCDVEGCKGVSCNGGGCWTETGYWKVCPEHSQEFRLGNPQPKMKQSAIDREASRDKNTGCLPTKNN